MALGASVRAVRLKLRKARRLPVPDLLKRKTTRYKLAMPFVKGQLTLAGLWDRRAALA